MEKPKNLPSIRPINNMLIKSDINKDKQILDSLKTNKKQCKNTVLNLTNKSENQDLNIFSKAQGQESSKAKIKINQLTNEKVQKLQEEKSISQLLKENIIIDFKSIINNFNTFFVKLKNESDLSHYNKDDLLKFQTLISQFQFDNHDPKYLCTVTKVFFDIICSYENKLIERIEDVSSSKMNINSIYTDNILKENKFKSYLLEQIEINSNLSTHLKEKILNQANEYQNKVDFMNKKHKMEIKDIKTSNDELINRLDLANIKIQQTHIYEWQIRLSYLMGFLLGIFIVFVACNI